MKLYKEHWFTEKILLNALWLPGISGFGSNEVGTIISFANSIIPFSTSWKQLWIVWEECWKSCLSTRKRSLCPMTIKNIAIFSSTVIYRLSCNQFFCLKWSHNLTYAVREKRIKSWHCVPRPVNNSNVLACPVKAEVRSLFLGLLYFLCRVK